MGLSTRIRLASAGLCVFGIMGVVGLIFSKPPLLLWTSGIVTYALQLQSSGPASGALWMAYGAGIAFCALSAGVYRRVEWAAILALGFVLLDGVFLFVFGRDVGSGLWGSLALPNHALVVWWTFDAIRAMRQWRVNESIARGLDVEFALKRKLEENEGPPPPAATFDTRYRPTLPPGAI